MGLSIYLVVVAVSIKSDDDNELCKVIGTEVGFVIVVVVEVEVEVPVDDKLLYNNEDKGCEIECNEAEIVILLLALLEDADVLLLFLYSSDTRFDSELPAVDSKCVAVDVDEAAEVVVVEL